MYAAKVAKTSFTGFAMSLSACNMPGSAERIVKIFDITQFC
jgi:hypothetical protein